MVGSTQPLGQQGGPASSSGQAGQGLQMVPVRSSQVASVGYDAAKKELYVSWQSGKTSIYSSVPATVHADLMRAPSVGKHLNQTVKPLYAHRYASGMEHPDLGGSSDGDLG